MLVALHLHVCSIDCQVQTHIHLFGSCAFPLVSLLVFQYYIFDFAASQQVVSVLYSCITQQVGQCVGLQASCHVVFYLLGCA